MSNPHVVCFFTGAHGDWGGASRVIYTAIRNFDQSRLSALVMLPMHGPIEKELDSRGIRHIKWGGLTEFKSPFSYFKSFFRALRLYRAKNVRAIHVNFAFWRPAEILAARVLGIPVVAHYHLLSPSPGPFIRLCRAVICVSHYTAEHSSSLGVEKKVIYNPIDLARFEGGRNARTEFGCSADNVVVSFMGQIREIKGVQDFISMAKIIKNPNVRFLIAGECRDPVKFSGSYSLDQLNEMISSDSRIRYLGYVGAVEDIYQSSDIIVFPSRWQEPLGLIPLEAGACRKPVVSTRVGGIPEIVNDGDNGFVVEPADPGSLAERTLQLVNDPALRNRLGENGRKNVERNFTSRPVQELEALLLGYCD